MKSYKIVLTILFVLILSAGLAWISPGMELFSGWGSFLGVLVLGVGMLIGGWQALRRESVPPPWLGWLLLGAVVVRLGAGILWFTILPKWGYETVGETAGYVMSDAYNRDTTAWELSQSDKGLFAAFQDYRLADQYGGLLFFSAGVYRFLGGNSHQPLQMVVLTAAFSSLAVLFTWAFTRRLWGETAARVSAWILALYPEAVLLGSSQMREAFMMTLAAAAFYGLVVYWQNRKRGYLVGVIGVLVVSVPLSSLFAILLGVVLIGLALTLER